MHRLQLAIGDVVTAIFLDGPVRATAWAAALLIALCAATGWRVALAILATGSTGAAVWWALSKWRCRP